MYIKEKKTQTVQKHPYNSGPKNVQKHPIESLLSRVLHLVVQQANADVHSMNTLD